MIANGGVLPYNKVVTKDKLRLNKPRRKEQHDQVRIPL